MELTEKLQKMASDSATAYANEQANFYHTVCHDEFNQGYTAGALEVLAQAEKLEEALNKILKKNPNAVNQIEAADMAVEFHMLSHIALAEYKAWKGEK